ncbi:hypothetical protein EC991_008082 [Linnemannia zychae]|nr:hypothetical protein EC991_008082 [Linnemannia zychae]
MAPSSCFVLDPMDCIYEKRGALFKRAPPADAPTSPPPPSSPPTTPPASVPPPVTAPAVGDGGSTSTANVGVIIGATLGSLALVFGLALFYCCMRKRRASRRIGQLQHFLPTFMDQEKTEKYFQHHNSSSTLVVPGTNPANASGTSGSKDPVELTNAHHRVRSAPIAFAKGVTDHRNRQLERDGSLGQFQQISLASDSDAVVPPHVHDQKDEVIPRRSLSGNGSSIRARASTVTAPAPVVSSLHRSMSLNKHSSRPINSRSNLEDEEEDEEAAQADRFAEGESLIAPNRFSALLELSPADLNNLNNANRFSATSYNGGLDPVFDPTRFSTASVMFDAKRISNLSTASSEESVSDESSSDEFNNNLPPHQKHHSFHSHHTSPTMRSRELATTDVPGPIVPNHPAYIGDKQELNDDDDDDDVPAPAGVQQQTMPQFHVSTPSSISRQGTPSGYPQGPPALYPPQHQQQNPGWPSSNMPLPMAMPVPQPYQPPSVLISQASDGEGDAH